MRVESVTDFPPVREVVYGFCCSCSPFFPFVCFYLVVVSCVAFCAISLVVHRTLMRRW